MKTLLELRQSSQTVKTLALNLKNRMRRFHQSQAHTDDLNDKIDLLSTQMLTLSSLMLLTLATTSNGKGLFSKNLIFHSSLTEEHSGSHQAEDCL